MMLRAGLAMALLIDETAKGIALNRWALPECLHVPIAAVDEDAIRNYVGDVERVVSGRGLRKALLVIVPERAPIDPFLPISDHPNAGIFHARLQVWVAPHPHVSPKTGLLVRSLGAPRSEPPCSCYLRSRRGQGLCGAFRFAKTS
jgi:hypothetical protein